MSRQQMKFNLDWKFLKGNDERAWYKGYDDSHFEDITLPHDWSVKYPFSKEHSSGTGYLIGGKAWYRKHFNLDIDKNKRVLITFDGVYNRSQVWCNSTLVGGRPYGYSAFTVDVTDFVLRNGTNCISVKVNHDELADSRWFTGSGIYRDVMLTITDDICIDEYGVFVTTKDVTDNTAIVQVQNMITNYSKLSKNIEIKNQVLYQNKEVASSVVAHEIGSCAEINCEITIPDVLLWNTKSPNLYQICTQVICDNEVVDEVFTNFGVRTIKFCPDTGFYLNDENMKLKGVCVHHDAGCLGAAVPRQVWETRLKKLKDMGCNAIRTAHNPPASYLFDLCDEMGFLAMDEAFDEWEGPKNKWWQGHNVYPPKNNGYYEDFLQWGERDVKDMVRRDRNHPSIIMWSIGNEVDYPNDPYCHPLFDKMTGNNDKNKPESERMYDPNKPNADRLAVIATTLAKYVKECDTSRPVTAALAFPELSNLIGYAQAVDIVGYNYKEHLYEQDHKTYPDHIIYGSENGSDITQWNAVRDNDYICGQFIWTGFDFLGEAQGWPIRISQAGFLDVAGNEKPRYYYRKSLWSDEQVLYIGTSTIEKDWKNHAVWDYNEGQLVYISCYTNCKEVELFLNDKSIGIKKLSDYSEGYIPFEVNFIGGTLTAIGTTYDGKQTEFSLHTDDTPKCICASVDKDTIKTDKQDVCQIAITLQDTSGNIMTAANNWITVGVGSGLELLGLENGDPADLTPYPSTKRKLYYGRLVAYVRAKSLDGVYNVSLSCDGAEPVTIELTSVQ